MGNRHSHRHKVNAAESQGGFFETAKAVFSSPAHDDASKDATTVAPSSTSPVLPSVGGAGDAPAQKPAPASSEPDPRTIQSSIPSFPGSWNELHKAKEIFPMPSDGVKLTINKGLSPYFQVNHTFTLGTMQPSGYKFGATYVGSKQLSQTETFPILLGEIDPSGNLNAQCIHAFSRRTRSRFVTQFQGNKMAALEMGTDYRGDSLTASVTAANPDLLSQTGILVGQCLYAVTPSLAVGVEGLVHRAMNPTIRQLATQASASLVAKYNAEKWSATVQAAPLERGLHASYWHKLSDNQAFGVELEGKGLAGECATTVGYSFDIPGADCSVKAQVDTNFNIGTTVEKKLTPLPMSVTLSCQGNQKKAQYLTGIGLTIG